MKQDVLLRKAIECSHTIVLIMQFKVSFLPYTNLPFGSGRDQTLIVRYPTERSFFHCSCLGTSTLWGTITLSWKHGEQSSALVASFPLLAEHVPTVVNLSMYRALVGTVWATIRTGASIHHGQVTYSTLSEETKWSFWTNVNSSQWTISGAIWTTEELSTERVQSPINIQGLLCSVHMSWLMLALHFKCCTFSSWCNYPIVSITQKITLLCTSTAPLNCFDF